MDKKSGGSNVTEKQTALELLQMDGHDSGIVECLGQRYENDQVRREHYLSLLKAKLLDPEFRKIPGFPNGSDEAILRMSDPPYYTACPNPFLEDFIRCYGKPYDPEEPYEREPFAVDVSVGKTDQLYKAHGYHTKVPHLAIVPSILHYTKPGDVVLDGFCGSGMTGLATQWCGTAPASYRQELETLWAIEGHAPPDWGIRRAVLNDLGPAASFIAAGYNLPFNVQHFEQEAQRILDEVEEELGWMYEALHTDGKTKGRINFTVWSEVFSCPECTGEVNFIQEALDIKTKRTRDSFPCPHCGALLNKDRLDRTFETRLDPITQETWKRIALRPAFVNYNVGAATYERPITELDLELLAKIEQLPYPADIPSSAFPIAEMYHGSRLDPKGFSRTHHLFLPRAAHALAAVWRKARDARDSELRRMLLWFSEQAIWSMSVLNRYRPTGYSQVGQSLTGVYYVASQTTELSPWYILSDKHKRTTKVDRMAKCFTIAPTRLGAAALQTGDCASIPIPGDSVDYIFTDPPFGENIYYADLNFLVESWHGVSTASANEAIVDQAKKKGVHEYQDLIRHCFAEYNRVLKPGRWMTVVFSNSSNGIWRAIQEAMGSAGFVIADVRTLDKQQGSYRQVTSSAVKQDLVISAYKPTEALEKRFELGKSSAEAAWAFVREHLHNVPVFVGRSNEVELVVERTAQMLLDRMIAFHVQHGVSVPLSGPEFLQGLSQRFPERDGMYFLSDQVTEYDRKRTSATQLRQLSFFVNDEHSAIQWIRQQLQDKPQSFQDLQPQFMRELQAWAKHEQTVELKTILEQNFLQYDGRGPVPSQIHSYLSTNFKDLRNLDKENATLREKAQDRWYVPDPNKQGDLDQVRDRALLKEFEEVKESSQRKIKVFRTEAIRAGFKACWQTNDYATIVKVATKLPEAVLQEDEKLLMYVDNAQTRLGDDA
jgi:16S rRNA G966 N2-methylase RsmD